MDNCIFCHQLKEEQLLLQTRCFKVVFDIDPIQDGHLLIISNKHRLNLTELTDEELIELIRLEQLIVQLIEEQFEVQGVTIASNNGAAMDPDTHFHVHVIPRYKEDGFWERVQVNVRQIARAKLAVLVNDLAEKL
ncbi:HIT family protein [Macrococcus equipercicus]|uniref:HIT family protein n=1 Tax=Macrococcus equipercicus TaxID=69967 RepID=A0ABQ6R9S1_9STAP|nr:HIT family protein [Macrococcus equipercicus]KAA1040044.1 HIT family protein [Macrococcus equipercicus]